MRGGKFVPVELQIHLRQGGFDGEIPWFELRCLLKMNQALNQERLPAEVGPRSEAQTQVFPQPE